MGNSRNRVTGKFERVVLMEAVEHAVIGQANSIACLVSQAFEGLPLSFHYSLQSYRC